MAKTKKISDSIERSNDPKLLRTWIENAEKMRKPLFQRLFP